MSHFNVASSKVSRLIGSIYEAAHEQADWTEVIRQVESLFNGSRACLAMYNQDPELSRVIANTIDAEMTARFFDFGPNNEWIEAFNSAPVGRVYRDHELIGLDRLRRSAVWNDWMKPLDMYGSMSCKLFSSGSSTWFFDVQRGRNQEAFDEQDMELLELLIPHMIRAGQISQGLALKHSLASATHTFPFGHIVTDSHQRIVSMNAVAGAILAQSPGLLSAKAGFLTAQGPEYSKRLQNLIVGACRIDEELPGTGGEMTIRNPGGDLETFGLAISVAPLAGTRVFGTWESRHAAIFVRQISLNLCIGFPAHIQEAFGLTPAEARLAAALAGGRTLRQGADEAHISFGSARRYLERIFRKTDTRQQSQLVALLKSAEPFGRHSILINKAAS